jgi:hypothetical protein
VIKTDLKWRPISSSEGAPHVTKTVTVRSVTWNLVMSPKRSSTPRWTGRLTVNCELTWSWKDYLFSYSNPKYKCDRGWDPPNTSQLIIQLRHQVLTALSMKMRDFWDIVLCGLIGVDQRFNVAYCLHHQGNDCPDDGGSSLCTSKMFVCFYETKWYHIPEDCDFHTCYRKNLISHSTVVLLQNLIKSGQNHH